MAKIPSAKEVLTDPKYTEQKGFFKELFSGLVEEMRDEEKKAGKKGKKVDTNIFDDLFGGNTDDED